MKYSVYVQASLNRGYLIEVDAEDELGAKAMALDEVYGVIDPTDIEMVATIDE